MEVKDKIVLVTGAAGGIGSEMCRRFASLGAKHVVCVDLDLPGAQATADACNGSAFKLDVADYQATEELVDRVETDIGGIDLFCANAGVSKAGGATESSLEDWEFVLDINLKSHIYTGKIMIPRMEARGSGYLLFTASAAGLLTQIGSITYAVSKHAAVSHAEFLAINHGDKGIGVSCLCPQAVRTNMTAGAVNGGVAGVDGMIEPEQCVDAVIETLASEQFLVLPHDTVKTYMNRKAGDIDRWISGMRKLRDQYVAS